MPANPSAGFNAGPYFRKIRRREGETVKSIAARLELSESYVSDVERGFRMLPPAMYECFRKLGDPVEGGYMRQFIKADLWRRWQNSGRAEPNPRSEAADAVEDCQTLKPPREARTLQEITIEHFNKEQLFAAHHRGEITEPELIEAIMRIDES